MIVPMKKVSVIVQTHKKRSMLRTLRNAGVLHVFDSGKKSETEENLKKNYESLSLVRNTFLELQNKKHPVTQKAVSDELFEEIQERHLSLLETRKRLLEEISKDASQIETLRPWGDFNPKDIAFLEANGVVVYFYTMGKKDLASLPKEIKYILLDPMGSLQVIAVPKEPLPSQISATRFFIPESGLSQLVNKNKQDREKVKEIEGALSEGVQYLEAYELHLKRSEQSIRFEQIANSTDGGEELTWITGYIPVTSVDDFSKLASKQGWGYQLDDPTEEDDPPTLIKYPKGFGIVKPIFDILGTVPGYRENDISMWFLLFFTLFFAMIIGDAGYGLIFLSAAVGLHIKGKKATNAVLLLYVLSIATVVWGALTGTWFGSEKILVALPFLQKLVIPSITNFPELFGVTTLSTQNHVMKFCFMIGTVQLSLACILNVVHKAAKKDISLVSDIGWLIDVLALYFIVLQLVVGESANLSVVGSLVGVGFLLVCVFGAQGPGIPFLKGLASGLGGFFTTFLNTISCFSNIMSYIRLFAVGMASVAIAQSFNSMAGGMMTGFAAFAGIAVLIIGHSLNLVMGILSVVVHGVRLNLLEFSGQLGMEWTGISYEPFSQTVSEN
ncbi:ATPase [uncultured Sphaerochaeta sp.]|uniref:V-type ATP synthase subunit I n=1 Tax=uncultured Sphaerochaeta sp. TaxID=886478 RepID=UPI002A0A4D91|nr:ATPase [uncultured Sphaerochaeta sp.]